MIKAFKVLLESNKSGEVEVVYMYKGVQSGIYTRRTTSDTLVKAMKDWYAKEVVVATQNKVMCKDRFGSDYFVEYNNVPEQGRI